MNLINNGKNTVFGKDHVFSSIKSYSDFKKGFLLGCMKDLSIYKQGKNRGRKYIVTKKTNIFL